jgi:hypothetical protein
MIHETTLNDTNRTRLFVPLGVMRVDRSRSSADELNGFWPRQTADFAFTPLLWSPCRAFPKYRYVGILGLEFR